MCVTLACWNRASFQILIIWQSKGTSVILFLSLIELTENNIFMGQAGIGPQVYPVTVLSLWLILDTLLLLIADPSLQVQMIVICLSVLMTYFDKTLMSHPCCNFMLYLSCEFLYLCDVVKVQNAIQGCRMQDPLYGCNSDSPSVLEQ